jgi:cell division protein FtsZ
VSISGAKGVLMNITCTSDLTMEEMTEASDCIYNEVGEDAEIIWGQTFDENLGDEMRVTVIATGIGEAPTTETPDKTISPIKLIDDSFGEDGIRENFSSKRSSTHNQADKTNTIDYDDPTYMRRREAIEENVRPLHNSGRTDKYDGIAFDNNDLDVPTFLRKKAN